MKKVIVILMTALAFAGICLATPINKKAQSKSTAAASSSDACTPVENAMGNGIAFRNPTSGHTSQFYPTEGSGRQGSWRVSSAQRTWINSYQIQNINYKNVNNESESGCILTELLRTGDCAGSVFNFWIYSIGDSLVIKDNVIDGPNDTFLRPSNRNSYIGDCDNSDATDFTLIRI